MRNLRWLLPILGILVGLSIATVMANNTFPTSADTEEFGTQAVFKIIFLSGDIAKTPMPLNDPATTIGITGVFIESDEAGSPVLDIGTVAQLAPFPNVSPVGLEPCRPPTGFPEGPGSRREVHTEILSLELTNGGMSLKAGQPYTVSLNNPAAAFFYRDSFGEVASQDPFGVESNDFHPEADSYFNVFVEVMATTPGGPLFLYNLTPMVLRTTIDKFPPTLGLPEDDYIHDPNFPAVPLFDSNGIHQAYLVSAGHGGPTVADLNLDLGNAPQLVGLGRPVTFTVDAASIGLPPPVSSPNDVWVNQGLPVQDVTLYQSSGVLPGRPDGTNISNLAGRVTDSSGNPAQQRSISYGGDGTVPFLANDPTPGVLYFSVDRDSDGQVCTDVWHARFTAQGAPPAELDPIRQAAPIFVSGVSPFGVERDTPVRQVPMQDNFLVVDGTALGLRPMIGDPDQDNVTGLEVSARSLGDLVYATFTGSSFGGPGETATIYSYDPASGPFNKANLLVYAGPASLGLVDGDIIDAIAVSASSNEVLFSLAPGSPSLGPTSAADILYSALGDAFSLFAPASKLGLLTSDNVDAIDIRPTHASIGGATTFLTDDSNSALSTRAIAALAGVFTLLIIGGWYARRRWPVRR